MSRSLNTNEVVVVVFQLPGACNCTPLSSLGRNLIGRAPIRVITQEGASIAFDLIDLHGIATHKARDHGVLTRLKRDDSIVRTQRTVGLIVGVIQVISTRIHLVANHDLHIEGRVRINPFVASLLSNLKIEYVISLNCIMENDMACAVDGLNSRLIALSLIATLVDVGARNLDIIGFVRDTNLTQVEFAVSGDFDIVTAFQEGILSILERNNPVRGGVVLGDKLPGIAVIDVIAAFKALKVGTLRGSLTVGVNKGIELEVDVGRGLVVKFGVVDLLAKF